MKTKEEIVKHISEIKKEMKNVRKMNVYQKGRLQAQVDALLWVLDGEAHD